VAVVLATTESLPDALAALGSDDVLRLPPFVVVLAADGSHYWLEGCGAVTRVAFSDRAGRRLIEHMRRLGARKPS